MNYTQQEVEAKFYLRDQQAFERRLISAGGQLTVPRVFEINLRFDTPDGSLALARQVLRLRRDTQAVMTYKGPMRAGEEVSVRREIEFEVSDFAAARSLLEALGYQVVVMYEKYRTTYRFLEVEVMLDEMPYGAFVEIEGADPGLVRTAADRLGLRWDARSQESYLALFEGLRSRRGFRMPHLSFDGFKGITVKPEDLQLDYAD
jgi:adenylate cyclase class 2